MSTGSYSKRRQSVHESTQEILYVLLEGGVGVVIKGFMEVGRALSVVCEGNVALALFVVCGGRVDGHFESCLSCTSRTAHEKYQHSKD